VLCYHRVEDPPRGHDADTNFVTPARFAAHLAALGAAGFSGVTIRDVLAWQRGERTLPPKPIAITFDDAYESVRRHAIPLLDGAQWPCTIYVVTGELGGTNRWDSAAPPATLLDGAALRALADAGHDVGSHTQTHVRVRGLDRATALAELRTSREQLQAVLGAPVTSLAFPYGSHDARALDAVREAGYTGAVTLKRWWNGRGTNPLRLGRIGVGGPLSAAQLRAKLLKARLTPARG
jgi:peptidoglycan/xylan/chitin deacetylase (PgdA/CDA1 family)